MRQVKYIGKTHSASIADHKFIQFYSHPAKHYCLHFTDEKNKPGDTTRKYWGQK